MMGRNYTKLIMMFFVLCLMSCDKRARVAINSPASEFEFDCGEVVLEARSMKAIIFSLRQTFKLNEEVILYPQNLRVEDKGMPIEYSIWYSEDDAYFLNKKNRITSEIIREKDSLDITLEFSLERSADVGDIIKIDASKYIKCQNKWIITEPILIEIKEVF